MIDFDNINCYDKLEMCKCIGETVKFCSEFMDAPSYTKDIYIITDVVWFEKRQYYLFKIKNVETDEYYNGSKSIVDGDEGSFGGFAMNKFVHYPEGKKLYRGFKLEKLLTK
jgi:hypothetical protein